MYLATKINTLFLFSVLIFSLTLHTTTFLSDSESNFDGQESQFLLVNSAFAQSEDDEDSKKVKQEKQAEKEAEEGGGDGDGVEDLDI